MKHLLILLMFLPARLLAEDTSIPLATVEPTSSTYLIKLTAGLVAVLALVFILAWLVKKMQLVQHSNNGLIQIVSAIAVGQRERIALIQVGDEQILVALSPGKIEKLHTLKQSISTEVDKPHSPSSFQQKFQQVLKREGSDA